MLMKKSGSRMHILISGKMSNHYHLILIFILQWTFDLWINWLDNKILKILSNAWWNDSIFLCPQVYTSLNNDKTDFLNTNMIIRDMSVLFGWLSQLIGGFSWAIVKYSFIWNFVSFSLQITLNLKLKSIYKLMIICTKFIWFKINWKVVYLDIH